jgi:hypothetical protein
MVAMEGAKYFVSTFGTLSVDPATTFGGKNGIEHKRVNFAFVGTSNETIQTSNTNSVIIGNAGMYIYDLNLNGFRFSGLQTLVINANVQQRVLRMMFSGLSSLTFGGFVSTEWIDLTNVNSGPTVIFSQDISAPNEFSSMVFTMPKINKPQAIYFNGANGANNRVTLQRSIGRTSGFTIKASKLLGAVEFETSTLLAMGSFPTAVPTLGNVGGADFTNSLITSIRAPGLTTAGLTAGLNLTGCNNLTAAVLNQLYADLATIPHASPLVLTGIAAAAASNYAVAQGKGWQVIL